MKFIFVFMLLVISGCSLNPWNQYTNKLESCYEKYDAKEKPVLHMECKNSAQYKLMKAQGVKDLDVIKEFHRQKINNAKAYKKGDITYTEMENANREAHKASVMELEVRKK